MELFLFRHDEWLELYNCSLIQIDSLPLEVRGGKFHAEAWATIMLCALYYVLYGPCLVSIWRNRHQNACYLLLFYIGLMDVGILWILGFLHGILTLQGAVFCSSPTLLYWVGILISS
jgi:hypothetical protein